MKKILVFLVARLLFAFFLLMIFLGIMSIYSFYYAVETTSALTIGTIIIIGGFLTNKDIRKEFIDLVTKEQQ